MIALLGLALGACAGAPSARAPAPEHAVEQLEIEYRQIGLGISCIGNWRLRIAADGALYHARNTKECADGPWSDPFPASPQRTLAPDELAALASWVQTSGLLDLDPVVTDPKRSTSDGSKEEIVLTLDGQQRTIEVINTRVEVVVALRQRLLGLLRGR